MREQAYDDLVNEGGDGYNPIREARRERECQEEAARPKSYEERISALQRTLDALDCSVARESGTYDQVRIDHIRADIAALEAAELAAFLVLWTPEVTRERREAWNAAVRAGQITQANAMQAQRNQGWWLRDLTRAVDHYKPAEV